MRVVICGGGVIGACTAYFLSSPRDQCHRRGTDRSSRCGIRQGWRLPGARLVRRHSARCAGAASFGLHAALPNEIAGDWGYRRMTAYSGFVVPERDRPPSLAGQARLALRRRGHRVSARHDGDDRDRSPARLHRRHDERRRGEWCRTAPRAGHRHRSDCGWIGREGRRGRWRCC